MKEPLGMPLSASRAAVISEMSSLRAKICSGFPKFSAAIRGSFRGNLRFFSF
jgi:hypothetical protein